MKVKMESGAVILSPENAEDYAAIHQIKVCGVKSMAMLNSCINEYGPALRGPLVLELYPEKHGLAGSLNSPPI